MDELERLKKERDALKKKIAEQDKKNKKKVEIKNLKKEISDLKYGKMKKVFKNIGNSLERVSIGNNKSGVAPHSDLVAPVPKKICPRCKQPTDMLIGGFCMNCC